jgi:hexosaminidase
MMHLKKNPFFAFLLISSISFAQEPALIPIPVSAEYNKGNYDLGKIIIISAPKEASLQVAFDLLNQKLGVIGKRKIQWLWETGAQASMANIRLELLSKNKSQQLGKEGYSLTVNAKGIQITANEAAGLFYGIQTLTQLLPKELASKSAQTNLLIKVPFAKITDYPKFVWRGMMFDVSRHFFTKAEVKQFIDEMAEYKYNILHFHLTDDEGWRIEIKAYPNLTKKGAFNVKKIGRFTEFSKPEPNEPRDFGGFYTQEDLKELIQYAKDRFIEIMPEVDVPGHSMAVIASYPELSCTPEAINYQVISGEPFIDWSTGHAIALQDNTLCPANEKVYTFLDKVFGEISAIFPFEYMHIGGDECPKNYWEKNPQILAMMKREGLNTTQEVQAFFTRRLSKIVASKGKKMMGWDEILEGGGLPQSTAVMSWRGEAGGIQAAKDGHEVVMTPNNHVYVDLMQGDIAVEPQVYNTVRLKDSYDFNPTPAGINEKFVKGGQANLWSEQLFSYRHLQYMVYPRSFAVAERLWSPRERTDWNGFINRVESHFERFDAAEKKYAPSMYEPKISFTKNDKNEIAVELTPEISNVSFHYSFDNSYPDKFYPVAVGKVLVPKDAEQIRIISIKNGKQVGRFISISRVDMIKRSK